MHEAPLVRLFENLWRDKREEISLREQNQFPGVHQKDSPYDKKVKI